MKTINVKSLIFLGYFLGIFILRKIGIYGFSFASLQIYFWQLIWWFLGALLGVHFLKIDQLINVFFNQPETQLSLQVKWLLKQRKIGAAWDLLNERIGEQRLILRSALFQVAWVILAIFILTSTITEIGHSLVMAIGLALLLEEWEDILACRNISWLFWQIKREVTLKEQKIYLYVMNGIFLLLSLIV